LPRATAKSLPGSWVRNGVGPATVGVATGVGVEVGVDVGPAGTEGHGVDEETALDAGVTAALPHAPATRTATMAAPMPRIPALLDCVLAGIWSPNRSHLANMIALISTVTRIVVVGSRTLRAFAWFRCSASALR
jgi:hypothetical protein